MSLSRNPKLVEIAKFICRDLRKHSTDSEQVFWEAVRNRKFLNIKFYRQYPLFFDYFGKETFYVADFYCHENSIAVEIDGAYHKRQKDYDELKNEVIKTLGIRMIRFTNEEVLNDFNGVLSKLEKELSQNSP